MILTVTLNPVLDRVVEITDFRVGKVNRVEKERIRVAGGKGINVSRVAKILGEPTLATGWLGGRTAGFIKERLKKEGIASDFVSIAGESRLNLTILDPVIPSQTHLVEKGPRIFPSEIKKLEEKVGDLVRKARVVVFSGSVPPGVSENIYNSLIRLVYREKENIIPILDTRGEPLKQGLQGRPFMLKPNKEEMENLMGKSLESEADLIRQVRALVQKYVQLVVVSRGKDKVMVMEKKSLLMVSPPEINSLNTIGAGDALVGGFAVGLSRGLSLKEMSVLAVACAAASAEEGREKPLSLKRINQLKDKIRWKEARE
ncbi:1-phosphofructokinase [Candidatus Aerophobetes bacterium Ae_b3b]|nr:MAG: 1-phosphofructokinase [Candidatus Aerophobetes bacterium Ae_b3b]